MAKTNDELAEDIRDLRNELTQMREIVGALFNILVELDTEDDDEVVITGCPDFLINDLPRSNT